jgi:hypothetical protein
VVRKSLVHKEQFTGETVTCMLADSTKRTVPVAKVDIDSPYLTGKFDVWCMENPVCDLIIGEVSNARKLHDPDPDWTPVLSVVSRQQKREKTKPVPSLKVPEIVKDGVRPENIHRNHHVENHDQVNMLVGDNMLTSEDTNAENIDDQEDEQGIECLSIPDEETYHDVEVNDDLQESQKESVSEVLSSKFPDVLTSIPGCTSVLQQDVRTTTERPVRIAPRLPLSARIETVKVEVRKLSEEQIPVLTEVLQKLEAAKLTAKPSKCAIAYNQLECFGHIDGREAIHPHPDKVRAVQEATRPTTKKQLRSFLGLVNFHRRFIPNCAHISLPLTDLTRKFAPNKIHWTESQEMAFQGLKKTLTSSPILKLPDLTETSILQTDASDRGIGVVLLQEENKVKQPNSIAFVNRKLKKTELNHL